MPIDKEINLDDPDGITQEDIDIMNRQADELEELAKNAEKNAEKIDRAKKSMEGMSFAQLNILNNENLGEVREGGRVSKGDEDDEDEEGKKGDAISKEELYDIIIEILAEQEKAKEERKENKKQISEAEKHRKELERKIASVEGSIKSGTNEMLSLRNSPMSFGKNKIFNMIGKAGIYGAIVMFAYEMVQQMYNQVMKEIKQLFGAGGAFDVRKTVLDEMNQVANMKHMIDVSQGTVFFTSDTSEVLRQGVPQTSNTRERVNGHKQYQQEFDK